MKSILRTGAVLAACLPLVAMADDVRVFQAAELVGADGAAWLKRTEDHIDGRVMAKVNMANSPYTIWWVIFNNPKACGTSPCSAADLGNAAADAAVFNAGGAISAASGELKANGKPNGTGVINLNISVVAGEGAGNGSQVGPPLPPFMRDLNEENGLGAEVHLVIDKHIFDSDWVTELTYPEMTEAFVIFLAVENDD